MTLFISPNAPTILGDESIYWLNDSDLMLQFPVETGFCFQGRLDEQRLVRALEETLSAFPTFCGRLIRETDRWGLRVHPPSPVELEFVEYGDLTMLPDDAVIQSTWHYSPPLDIDALLRYEDTPLFRMRVIKFDTTPPLTTLGLTSAHLAGDGTFLVRFWQRLSQAYQGLPLDAPPTYQRGHVDESCLRGYDIDHLTSLFPQLLTRNPQPPPPTERISLFFSLEQMERLRECIDSPVRLSLQDCVSALVLVACSKSRAPPVSQFTNVFNVRGGVLPQCEPLNALSWVNATTANPESVPETALAIRRAFLQARDPTFQGACLLTIRRLFRKAAREMEKVDLTPRSNEFLLNSSWRFDYRSAHFGFDKEKVHFLHTTHKAERYAKMFQRNPPMPTDKNGPKPPHPTSGAEITFYLKDRTEFIEHIRSEWKLLGMEGDIDINTM
ncbi:hypothetical protein CPB86DRAFT_717431 [Serendipita vermifera]|nr:hypothetical protein CPB86DRAFT_717431 [Serendipita vermifera]